MLLQSWVQWCMAFCPFRGEEMALPVIAGPGSGHLKKTEAWDTMS